MEYHADRKQCPGQTTIAGAYDSTTTTAKLSYATAKWLSQSVAIIHRIHIPGKSLLTVNFWKATLAMLICCLCMDVWRLSKRLLMGFPSTSCCSADEDSVVRLYGCDGLHPGSRDLRCLHGGRKVLYCKLLIFDDIKCRFVGGGSSHS